MNWQQIGAEAVITVLAAVVAVRLSLASFYSQKWWERKAEAYSEIMSALSRMERYAFVACIEMEQSKQPAADIAKQRYAEYQEARNRIEHVTSIGAFVISTATALHLSALREELEAAANLEPDWYQVAYAEHSAVLKAIEAVRTAARAELYPWYRFF